MRIKADASQAKRELSSIRGSATKTASAFSRMKQIAGGILMARAFQAGVDALARFGREAISATGTMQMLNLQIETLAARELKNAGNAMIDFADTHGYYSYWAKETYVRLDAFKEQLAAVGLEMSNVSDKFSIQNKWGAEFAVITDEAAGSLYDAGDMMGQAESRAADMIKQLRRIAIISPYTLEATNSLFKLALAFGFAGKDAMKMTEGMLNVGAGIGATTEQTERMMFNFAQIRMQGKIMSRDFWELGKAGFDLSAVLKELSHQTGLNVNSHLDFNKAIASGQITWEQFADAFSQMAEKDFGGAAEKMAYTVEGLKNTFSDVFKLTIPQLLIPAAEVFGKFAQGVVDNILNITESGVLESMGKDIAQAFESALRFLGADIPNPMDALVEDEKGIMRPARDMGQNMAKEYSDGFFGQLSKSLDDAALLREGFDMAGMEGLIWMAERQEIISPTDAENLRNLASAWGDFKLAVSGFTQELFAPLLGFFENIGVQLSGTDFSPIETLTNLLNGIATFLNENPELPAMIQRIVIAIGTFALVASVIGVISSIAGVLSTIGASGLIAFMGLSPLTAAIALLFAVVAAYGPAAYENFMGLAATLGEFLKAVKDVAMKGLAILVFYLLMASTWAGNLLQKLEDFRQKVGTNIRQAFDDVVAGIKNAITWIGNLIEKLKDVVIPSWLKGHSPPPMADWFEYIGHESKYAASSLAKVNSQMTSMSRGALLPGSAESRQENVGPAVMSPLASSPFAGADITIQNPVDKQWLVDTLREG